MTDSILDRDRVNLTNCDREPIHIPGAILPHGVMLVLECDTLRVLQAAGNTTGLLDEDFVFASTGNVFVSTIEHQR